jgi:hypothetical protein
VVNGRLRQFVEVYFEVVDLGGKMRLRRVLPSMVKTVDWDRGCSLGLTRMGACRRLEALCQAVRKEDANGMAEILTRGPEYRTPGEVLTFFRSFAESPAPPQVRLTPQTKFWFLTDDTRNKSMLLCEGIEVERAVAGRPILQKQNCVFDIGERGSAVLLGFRRA